MTSQHYQIERKAREELIKQIGYGETVKVTVVDKGHKNGPEIHQLSNTGIITIYNLYTRKLITRLIARPGQVRRYYAENEIIPQGLIKLAQEHQYMMYNEC